MKSPFLYVLPAALSVMMNHPCVITDIEGEIGGAVFGYELRDMPFEVRLIDEVERDKSLEDALRLFPNICAEESKRLLAACIYFTRASRLVDAGAWRFEFLAEALLNLSKCLEVLFPPAHGQESRDGVRDGLKRLGLSNDEIEAYFIPILRIRSSLDVAHHRLGVPRRDQVERLISFSSEAVKSVREVLRLIDSHLKEGKEVVPACSAKKAK